MEQCAERVGLEVSAGRFFFLNPQQDEVAFTSSRPKSGPGAGSSSGASGTGGRPPSARARSSALDTTRGLGAARAASPATASPAFRVAVGGCSSDIAICSVGLVVTAGRRAAFLEGNRGLRVRVACWERPHSGRLGAPLVVFLQRCPALSALSVRGCADPEFALCRRPPFPLDRPANGSRVTSLIKGGGVH